MHMQGTAKLVRARCGDNAATRGVCAPLCRVNAHAAPTLFGLKGRAVGKHERVVGGEIDEKASALPVERRQHRHIVPVLREGLPQKFAHPKSVRCPRAFFFGFLYSRSSRFLAGEPSWRICDPSACPPECLYPVVGSSHEQKRKDDDTKYLFYLLRLDREICQIGQIPAILQ